MMNNQFDKWWYEHGSVAPFPREDMEEHTHRVAQKAWTAAISERIAELEMRLAAMEQAYKEGITYGQYKAALGGEGAD